MQVIIRTVPQEEQRYSTIGDYWDSPEGTGMIVVTQLKDWRYEFLIALHEMVEKYLCQHAGIKEQEITDFDIKFEKLRKEMPSIYGTDEPGDNPQAPYHRQHVMATVIERMCAFELGVNWDEYEEHLNKILGYKSENV